MNYRFEKVDDLYLIFIRYGSQFFIPLRELRLIKSQFFDRDVGRVERIEIKAERTIGSVVNIQGWTLQEVLCYYFLYRFNVASEVARSTRN